MTEAASNSIFGFQAPSLSWSPRKGSLTDSNGTLDSLCTVVKREQGAWTRWGFSPEWAFRILPLRTDGENASKYLVSFFNAAGLLQKQLLLKRYHKPWVESTTVETEFRGLMAVAEAFQHSGRFRAPWPYGRCLDEKILFLEFCPSISLNRLLFQDLRHSRFGLAPTAKERLLATARDVGCLLAEFQAIPTGDAGATADNVLHGYRSHLLRQVESCLRLGVPQTLLYRLQDRVLQELTLGLSNPPLVGQHCDFGPWNLLAGQRYLYVIDLGNFRTGFPSYDAAFFYNALQLFARRRTVDNVVLQQVNEAFLEAYCRARLVRKEHLQFFDAFGLMQICYFASVLLCRKPSLRDVIYATSPRQFVLDWLEARLSS